MVNQIFSVCLNLLYKDLYWILTSYHMFNLHIEVHQMNLPLYLILQRQLHTCVHQTIVPSAYTCSDYRQHRYSMNHLSCIFECFYSYPFSFFLEDLFLFNCILFVAPGIILSNFNDLFLIALCWFNLFLVSHFLKLYELQHVEFENIMNFASFLHSNYLHIVLNTL